MDDNVTVLSSSQTSEMIQEIEALSQKSSMSNAPLDLKERVERMIDRLRRMAKYSSYSTEFEVVSKYIEWMSDIPWGKYTTDIIDLEVAKQSMDKHHYGMESIKNIILDYLAVMKLQALQGQSLYSNDPNRDVKLQGSSAHAPVLCFVGLQGVGKTSIAKSIAQALGREFIRIPMGALGGVRELRGIPRTSLEAEPGMIVKALTRAKTMNPLILLDEIDKTSGQEGLRSDMMAFLLEVLDPQQNSHFVDYYIDYPIDLSQVFFITTANTTGTISTALLDRLEVIRFTSYSDEEKIIIGKNYLLPSVMENVGLKPGQIIFKEDVWPQIVRPLGFDAGVRQLERNITKICRHAVREIVDKNLQVVEINNENVRTYLPLDVAVLN